MATNFGNLDEDELITGSDIDLSEDDPGEGSDDDLLARDPEGGKLYWDEDESGAVPEPDIPTEVSAPAEDGDAHPFWDARPELRTIHDFAKSRMVSPPAVLACAIARVIAHTPYNVVLPPTIGKKASLNLFVGFVGESGAGKGAAEGVAEEAVLIHGGQAVFSTSVVSGEAFTYIFGERRKLSRDEGGGSQVVRTNYNAIVSMPEIDMLAGLKARQGSTIMPTLRSVAMGERLGGHASTEEKRVTIEPLAYRCCLTAGVQPARSAVLFGDSDGGTPQRFLFVSATDPEAEMNPGPAPDAYVWSPPRWSDAPVGMEHGTKYMMMTIPQVAIDTTLRIGYERNRGTGNPLDGHRNLLQIKVAAGFAILARRAHVNEEDWELSARLLRHSDAQRERCHRALAKSARAQRDAEGRNEAHKEIAKADETEAAVVPALAGKVLRLIDATGTEGMAAGSIGKRVTPSQREHVEAALALLASEGKVVEFEATARNRTTSTRYRVVH